MIKISTKNCYLFYGFTVATPFSCPELLPSLNSPDVVVGFGNIDDTYGTWREQGACYKVSPEGFLLNVRDVARYLLSNGRQISVETSSEADSDSLRLFFYNEVAAILLMQKRMLVLKASVVARKGKAFILMGRTGVGKSISAAGLGGEGFSIVSDSVCAITIHNGEIAVLPGYPALMLWEKGMRLLKLSPKDHKPVRKGMNKFFLPVTENFSIEILPVGGICILSEQNRKEISSCDIEGANKLFALLNHQYHPRIAQPMDIMGDVNELAIFTAKQVRMQKIAFNMSTSSFENYIDLLGTKLNS